MTERAERGRWKVLKGIDYRVGDGWKRAEPGTVVDDLDDVTEADFAMLQKVRAIEPAKAQKGPSELSVHSVKGA